MSRFMRYTSIFAGAWLLSGTSAHCDSPQQDLPLPQAYKSLLVSAGAITGSSQELIQLERSVQRLQALRTALTIQLLNHNYGDTITIADAVDANFQTQLKSRQGLDVPVLTQDAILCAPRTSHIQAVAQFNFLNAVVSKIQELSKPAAATDLASALKAVLSSYSLSAADVSLASKDAIDALKNRQQKRCSSDIANFDASYYGVRIEDLSVAAAGAAPSAGGAEAALPALSFLGPIGVLIDTIVGIVTPVIIEASNLVDEAKREEAIRKFLSDTDNQNALQTSGRELARLIDRYTLAKRLRSSGAFVEALEAAKATQINLGKLDECKGFDRKFDRVSGSPPNAAFILCWRAAWQKLEPTVTSALKLADDYDRLADAGDTATAYTTYLNITKDLGAIRDNSVTNPNLFWRYVTQLVGFANTVQTAFSVDNREKIHKAIEGLSKAP
ncbi:hypothetical protein IVB41_15950 [Bradyrhizobium sp. 44]|uniref:hypothetical protein n=1 Tax=Bradyrhizobium sp. 44 TaxID=2782675 RepID=UPI001FF8012C|nr:hypothetical protein [Bradyrhizobium sp. 44]MCK1285414.1 hypothetical protein [Bradyrhizobium sp. 44]